MPIAFYNERFPFSLHGTDAPLWKASVVGSSVWHEDAFAQPVAPRLDALEPSNASSGRRIQMDGSSVSTTRLQHPSLPLSTAPVVRRTAYYAYDGSINLFRTLVQPKGRLVTPFVQSEVVAGAGLVAAADGDAITGTVEDPSKLYDVTIRIFNPWGESKIVATLSPRPPLLLGYTGCHPLRNRIRVGNTAFRGSTSDLVAFRPHFPPSMVTAAQPEIGVSVSPIVQGHVNAYSVSPPMTDGTTFDTTTGAVTADSSGPYQRTSYTVTASNVTGATAVVLHLNVRNVHPTRLEYPMPPTYLYEDVTVLPVVSAGRPYTFEAEGLPLGMTVDPDTGALHGAPYASGTFTTYITVTNVWGWLTAEVEVDVLRTPLDADVRNAIHAFTGTVPDFASVFDADAIVFARSLHPNLADARLSEVIAALYVAKRVQQRRVEKQRTRMLTAYATGQAMERWVTNSYVVKANFRNSYYGGHVVYKKPPSVDPQARNWPGGSYNPFDPDVN